MGSQPEVLDMGSQPDSDNL